MQCTSKTYPTSFVVTDPKGSILIECGKMLQKFGYRIRFLNTINMKKSMHYNPFAYIHSEKDILKLVTTLIANTKGEGKGGDDFWVKAETLLFTALIGYIHYEAPTEEQNFSTLLEMINAMEVREDDEEFENPVDLMFKELESRQPGHFAVRQYKKYKLAAGGAAPDSGICPHEPGGTDPLSGGGGGCRLLRTGEQGTPAAGPGGIPGELTGAAEASGA